MSALVPVEVDVVTAALQREGEMRQGRHRFISELDGPDYDDAMAAGDRAACEREATLYGAPGVDVRAGWTREP